MDENYYLYAITWAEAAPPRQQRGADPRFPVQSLRCGPLAAVVSRVGLDQFDPAKLQEGTADLAWLSEVALRHNTIVDEMARRWPTLPMRLGTLFQSEASLRSKIAEHGARVVEFLRSLGDRQEWAVKAYLSDGLAENDLPSARESSGHPTTAPPGEAASGCAGTQYLVARRRQSDRHHEMQVALKQDLAEVEARLAACTDAWCRLRPLSSSLTGRQERMVWNGAFLLSSECRRSFQAACDELAAGFHVNSLTLEATGPWPPYHFCPSLDG